MITALNHNDTRSTGYYAIFSLTLAIYLLLIAESFRMPRKKMHEKFHFWDTLIQRRGSDWNRLQASYFLLGIRNGVFWFGIAVLVYRVVHTELALGSYTMMSHCLALGTATLLTRWAGAKNRAFGLWTSAALAFLACAILSLSITYTTLLLFALFNSVATTWSQVTQSSMAFDIIEKAKAANRRQVEYLVAREVPLGLGRILGLSVFLFGISRFGEAGLRSTLFLLGLTNFAAVAVLPRKVLSLASRGDDK